MKIISLPSNVRAVKAKKLTAGMKMYFHNSSPMFVNSIDTNSEGKVVVHCGYTDGDEATPILFNSEDRALIIN
jgi:hypothetical protein